jgi:hypothetical protein
MSVEATSTLSVHLPGTSGYREATAVYDLFAPVQPDEAVIAGRRTGSCIVSTPITTRRCSGRSAAAVAVSES